MDIWERRNLAYADGRAQQKSSPADILAMAWAVLMITFPILGTFFPPETYFQSGSWSDFATVDSSNMSKYLTVIALSVVIYIVAMIRKNISLTSYFCIFVGLIYFISVFNSPVPSYSLIRFFRLLPTIAFGVILPRYLGFDRFVRVVVYAFLVCSICSIIAGAFFPQYGLSKYDGAYETAWRGALVHKNASSIIAVGIAFSIYAFLERIGHRSVSAITFLCCSIFIVMAQSGTALVCASASTAVIAVLYAVRRMDRQFKAMLIVICGLMIVPGMFFVSEILPRIVESLGRDMTLTGRTDIWRAVWMLIQDRPISGYGYSFWAFDTPQADFVTNEIGYRPAHSHNDWLELWLQLGILGPITIGGYLFYVVFSSMAQFVRYGETKYILIVAALTAMFMKSFSEVQYVEPGGSAIFWLIAFGACYGLARQSGAATTAPRLRIWNRSQRSFARGPEMSAP